MGATGTRADGPPAASAGRLWSMEHQAAFARATGDVNPMHMDPLAARRTLAGAAAVHGVHAALWALDACAGTRSFTDLLSLQMRFERFVLVGDRSVIEVQEDAPDRLRLSVTVEGGRALTIQAAFGPGRPSGAPAPDAADPVPDRPAVVDVGGLSDLAGAFRIPGAGSLAALAPDLARAIGPGRVAALGALSTLVGMVVPGLHSILSKIDVRLLDGPDAPVLAYRVRRYQPTLRSVAAEAEGPGLSARVESFVRPPPAPPESLAALKDLVAPGAFAGVRALVVGGSRGLGATTAKLLAAGGAETCITYATGAAEAEAVADEIRAGGGACAVLRLDAAAPVAGQLAGLDAAPTQLHHFATPRIFRQKRAPFEPACFEEMMRIYNYAFHDLCRLCLARGGRLAAFYPSTTAIDDPPRDTLEYVMAKTAGEVLARTLARTVPDLSVIVERLPRVDTDQTATIFPVPAARASAVMLPILRRMAG